MIILVCGREKFTVRYKIHFCDNNSQFPSDRNIIGSAGVCACVSERASERAREWAREWVKVWAWAWACVRSFVSLNSNQYHFFPPPPRFLKCFTVILVLMTNYSKLALIALHRSHALPAGSTCLHSRVWQFYWHTHFYPCFFFSLSLYTRIYA